MILMVAGASRYQDARIGDFVTPDRWTHTGATPVWAADNGAFSGFDESAYRRMLDRRAGAATPPRFVTLPDVVADHQRTLRLFGTWHRELAHRNLNRAFVLQNGIKDWKDVPWDYIEAVFIGGTTEWKLSEFAAWLVSYALRFGKWVHMGRVNSIRRLDYARRIGCHSCDGSGMARFRRRVLEPMRASLHREQLYLL